MTRASSVRAGLALARGGACAPRRSSVLSAPAIGEIHRFITLSFCPRITRMDANKKEFSRRSREAFGVRRRVVALKSFCVYSASSLDMAREEFVELVPLRKPKNQPALPWFLQKAAKDFSLPSKGSGLGRCEANGNSVVTKPQKTECMNSTNSHRAHEVFGPIQLVRIRAIRVF